MLCASPKVDISSKPTNSKDNHTESKKKEEKKKHKWITCQKQHKHTYTQFLSLSLFLSLSHTHTHTHTDAALSVSKQVFLSITQTAPSCVCQCYVKLLNSGTTSLVFTEMRLYVSLHCQSAVKEKEIEGTRKNKSSWKCSKIARKGATEHWNKPVWYSVQFQAGPKAQQAWEKHNQTE